MNSMEQKSPFVLVTRLVTQLTGVLSAVDVYGLPPKEAKLIATLKREAADARLDTRDYELSETRQLQLKNARAAKKRLDHVRKHILAVSEYNIFSAIDVAQLSAQIEQIIENIQ